MVIAPRAQKCFFNAAAGVQLINIGLPGFFRALRRWACLLIEVAAICGYFLVGWEFLKLRHIRRNELSTWIILTERSFVLGSR